MENKFCVKGDLEAKCKNFTFYEFPDEKNIISLILEYFKVALPIILKSKKDYYNQSIIINPDDIDLIMKIDYGKYVVVLSITDDNSTYIGDDNQIENTEYAFQVDLQVQADDTLESLENLIKLKSAIKILLTNMDNNIDLLTVIGPFSYGNFGIDEADKYVRQGIYTFSVEAKNYRK